MPAPPPKILYEFCAWRLPGSANLALWGHRPTAVPRRQGQPALPSHSGYYLFVSEKDTFCRWGPIRHVLPYYYTILLALRPAAWDSATALTRTFIPCSTPHNVQQRCNQTRSRHTTSIDLVWPCCRPKHCSSQPSITTYYQTTPTRLPRHHDHYYRRL